jgi:fructokinase
VLCFGEVLWDTFGNEQKPGGAPTNVALHLIKQGVNTSLLSRVGNDQPGTRLLDFLKQNHLYSGLLQVDEKLPTCQVAVKLNDRNEATYTIPKPVSWDNIQVDEVLQERIKHVSVVVFGSLACRCKTSRNTLLDLFENKVLKVFDVNLRHPHYEESTIQTLAAFADVIKMNEEEANLLIGNYDEPLTDKIIEFQKKFHSQTICVTRGENGAIVWHDEKFYEHPGFVVDVVDTVGAGDAFLATFITGLLNKQPMDQVLERACAIGAFVTSHRGANPDYDEPRIGEIIKSLESVA